MNRDEYARMYAHESHHWWYVGMRAISATLLDGVGFGRRVSRPSVEILDAGCGTGAGMEWLTQYGHVTGLDLSADALTFCRRRQLDQLVHGSIEHLPFRDASFDLVTTFDVLYHQWVVDEARALREFHRVLRPGGRLLLRVPALSWLVGHHDAAVHTRHRYSRCEIVEKLTASGFILERATYANTLLMPLVLGKRLAERWTPHSASDLDSSPGPLNAVLTWVMQLEAMLIRGWSFPCGVSVVSLARRRDAAHRDPREENAETPERHETRRRDEIVVAAPRRTEPVPESSREPKLRDY